MNNFIIIKNNNFLFNVQRKLKYKERIWYINLLTYTFFFLKLHTYNFSNHKGDKYLQ